MYIIELILKKILKHNTPPQEPEIQIESSENQDVISEECKHTFMPIDSSGEVFSCIKCGVVVKRKDLTPNNPFSD